MARSGSYVIRCRRNQLSAPQMYERGVDCAFREPRCIGDCAHTSADRSPFVSCSLTVEVQVNHERSGLLIVSDQIAHQHIQDVIVDGNGLSETRHRERMK